MIGVVGGQLAPLWQGTKDKAEAQAYLDQLLQVAAANGVVGRAEPVSVDAEAGPDPRFTAADAALAEGDEKALRAGATAVPVADATTAPGAGWLAGLIAALLKLIGGGK